MFQYIGYSGSDLQALCEEAAMMPIRELGANILTVKANQVNSSGKQFPFIISLQPGLFANQYLCLQLRRLRYEDFQVAMTVIRPSLNKSKWEELEKWNQEFGSN